MTIFEIGRVYHRRRDLHDRFGGQQQGGISTPREHSMIFLITGRSGASFGYDDFEDDEGVFHYFGEGQAGDMEFRGGNRAIRDHGADGKELHLFEQERPAQVRYRGQMTCSGWEYVDGVPDRKGNPRRAIVFQLVAAEDIADVEVGEDVKEIGERLDRLRAAALEVPGIGSTEARRRVYRRSAALRLYVLRRADGRCEGCGEAAPFETPGGEPYLEPHHTRRLSDGGPDDPRWVIAVCPTCHARVHYGADGEVYNQDLMARLAELEGS